MLSESDAVGRQLLDSGQAQDILSYLFPCVPAATAPRAGVSRTDTTTVTT